MSCSPVCSPSTGSITSVVRDLRSERPLTAIRAAELAGIMHAARVRTDHVRASDRRAARPARVRPGARGARRSRGDAADRRALAQDGNGIELGEILMSFGATAEPFLLRAAVRRAEMGRSDGLPRSRSERSTLARPCPSWSCEMLEDATRRCGPVQHARSGRSASARHGALDLALEHADPPFTGVAAASALGMLDDPAAAPRAGPGTVGRGLGRPQRRGDGRSSHSASEASPR